ncbi:DUF4278 domain-containing protein [Rivularia sp. UHCC 0363]|uniref:arginine synthesis PII-interacting regulator PirA n=1 Tax=Rivularia sp. UHCC 0363 TaxID=3110244 RepID=UPI002B1ED866|nr:DUF4278 domain-containing protein [Rivularia sp. UHCC 0363]MEA5595573.1 DUF4278 domain-containing protein [Rivularia sp. UHCC 0363]
MKLTYRGIKYENAPVAVEVITGGVCGKYRGAEWKCHYSRYTPATSDAVELKYRGAAYYSGNPQEVEKLKQRKKLNSIFASDKNLFASNLPKSEELNKTHLANLHHNLQRRLEVAKQTGDANLVRILEDEANQLSINN